MKERHSVLLSLILALGAMPAAAQNMGRAVKPVVVPVAGTAASGYVPMFNFSVTNAALNSGLGSGSPLLVNPTNPAGKLQLGPARAAAMSSGLPASPMAIGSRAGSPIAAAKEGQVRVGMESLSGITALQVEHSRGGRSKDTNLQTAVGMAAFDGGGIRLNHRDGADPIVGPAFEPPTSAALPPEAPPVEEGEGEEDDRLKISFPAAAKTGLLSYEPTLAINAAIRRVRDFEGSRNYWAQYKKGAEIDIVSKNENVFGRSTTITRAATKSIRQLTRDDFRGTVPEHQLKAGVRALRASLVANLEEKRRSWNASDPMVTLDTKVRVVAFKSFLDLFRESHGPNSVPTAEAPKPRTPLVIDTENPVLNPLTRFLPRAVYLDLDMLEGPISQDLLSDMAKLQRTGVYFVAFSRKPYAAAGAIKERLIRQMSSYQLSVLMPIRFVMVTDDGAVISEIPKGGNVTPINVAAFTDAETEVLRDAARKAAEDAGISPRAVREQAQPRLDDYADEIPGLKRRPRAATKQAQIRFSVTFPKSAAAAQLAAWRASFDKRIGAQGITPKAAVTTGADGINRFDAQKTDLASSFDRLGQVLGDKFGLYMSPADALILSRDPAMFAGNPGAIDLGKITGLKGAALVENALGLLLGEHRENRAGDLAGSASRMASFTRDRHRYLSESLIEQDKEEQNINFFSGHVVHAANDWLINEMQRGRKPTKDEYEHHLREHWNAGLLEVKPIGLPQGHSMEGWLSASAERGRGMYDFVMAAFARGEIVVGTEIPNFFVVKDYERRSGDVKRRYVLHTIFDFVALRPDPNRPGEAKVVIYDFKTGPAKTRGKLNKDLQVLTYAFFAHQKWVGRDFPVPYIVGAQKYRITGVSVEFIYNAVKQVTTILARDLDKIRAKIISTLNGIHTAEQKMLGLAPAKTTKAKANTKPKTKRSSK